MEGNGTEAPTEPSVDFFTSFIQQPTTLTAAFACAATAIAISGTNIFKHLLHYTEPTLQKSIVRILLMVPLYALFSFLALSITEWTLFFDSIRDIYEAFVIYCFLNLVLSYCGGENACLSVIMQSPGAITHVFPLSCCLPQISLTARFLRACKQMTLQFVIIKPVMAIINLLVVAGVPDGEESPRGWIITQAVVYNTSYTVALYGLMLFYKATRDHPGLHGQYPVLKFLSVKLVVFATYYQTVLVGIVPGVPERSLDAFNNFLLCCEMVVFAILQYFAFSWKTFRDIEGNKSPHIGSRHDSAFGGTTEMSASGAEPGSAGSNADPEAIARKAKDIINVQDVATDAYYNFNNKYGNHVLLDSGDSAMGMDTSLNFGGDLDDEDRAEVDKKHSKGRKKGAVKHMTSEESVNPFQNAGNGFGKATALVMSGSLDKPSHLSDDYSVDIDLSGGQAPLGQNEVPSAGDNPFAQEMGQLQRAHSSSGASDDQVNVRVRSGSFEFDSSAQGHSSANWTADFNDGQSSTKSKKKKSKAQTTLTLD